MSINSVFTIQHSHKRVRANDLIKVLKCAGKFLPAHSKLSSLPKQTKLKKCRKFKCCKIYIIIRPKPGRVAKNATPRPSGWESNLYPLDY